MGARVVLEGWGVTSLDGLLRGERGSGVAFWLRIVTGELGIW